MPILDPNTIEFFSRSPGQTRRIGMRLGALLRAGDVIALQGDLGSGKTTLIQGIAAGWGSLDQVTSPTFVLVNLYRRPDRALFYHLDAYRLRGPQDTIDLELEQMIAAGPLVVEWADHISSALPVQRLLIAMRWMADEQRGMLISAQGRRPIELLSSLRQVAFGVI